MTHEANLIILNKNRNLAATLVRPNRAQREVGAVLFLHGWAAQRHEVGQIYATLAHCLAKNGIASLRFDFFGCGESNPEFLANLTIGSMLQDAKIALCYLQQNIEQNTPVGLCGFSVGSAVMALLMHEYYLETSQYFPCIVGLSPIINLSVNQR